MAAAPVEFFVLWQGSGEWRATLTVEAATVVRAEPYMFLDPRDRVESDEPQRVICATHSRGNAAGLHVFSLAEAAGTVRLETNRGTVQVQIGDLAPHEVKVVPATEGKGYLLVGRGDPAPGPQHFYRAQMPKLFEPPAPRRPVALPDDWWQSEVPVQIKLSETPRGEVSIRRVARNDGRLYLQVFSVAGPLSGTAEVAQGGRVLGSAPIEDSLWLALAPRLGRVGIEMETPAGRKQWNIPATLVEVRGPRLFLNGEPFLIKGTLPGELSADDAEFIRSLGINTLRGGVAPKVAEQFGFMAIASIQGRKLRKLAEYRGARGREELAADLVPFYEAKSENGRAAADNPHTLIIQLDNERTEIGANPIDPGSSNTGADPWSDFVRGEDGEFVRLNRILAECWNLVKPMAPMLPLGYANESQGYLAPAFLDVYLHNSYLPRDRYGIPLADYARLQGGDWRPFINTEYGANRFTPEAYHGAKNSPLLEKLQAWGYRQTWQTFMAAGTIGGTSYKLYDSTKDTDQGTKNFGIMTADGQPKLACWELWHLWRDFEVVPATGQTSTLTIELRRDYAARECRLTIERGGQEWSTILGDFAPHGGRTVAVPFPADEFRWRIDGVTHRGLRLLATGAWPAAAEVADFGRRLAKRDAPEFLRTLLTARVLTAEGREAPPALVDMMGEGGVIPVAFRCRDGTIYVTAFTRRRLRDAQYVTADLRTAFAGEVVKVDEWTGQPIAGAVPCEKTPTGLVLKGVAIPSIPGPIGQRSNQPLALPVYRIRPGAK